MSLTLIISLFAVLALIIISAVLATADTGLTAASKARIHRLAREGNRRAAKVEKLLDNRERLVGSVLIGSTLANNLAASLSTFVLAGLFGGAAVLYATAAITILLLVFAEALPKTLGIARAERVALLLGPMVDALARLFHPIVQLMLGSVRAILKLFGIDLAATIQPTSHQEIRGTIDLHAKEGGIVREHRDMLGSILDLDEVFVTDVMVHRKAIEMIDADLPPGQIVRAAVRSSHTRLPLYRDNPDNIVGVLHSKDLTRALTRRGATPETVKIEKLLSPPWFVPNTTTLREQLSAFIAQRTHFALVVDEYGTLQGLVTLEDILEEIVGDITDEHDLPTPAGVTAHDDGTFTVEGTVTLRDLNRRFDWNLPDAEATTIAGLLINEARVIPVKGQSFTIYGFRFDVLERRRNQITLLRLTPPGHAPRPAE